MNKPISGKNHAGCPDCNAMLFPISMLFREREGITHTLERCIYCHVTWSMPEDEKYGEPYKSKLYNDESEMQRDAWRQSAAAVVASMYKDE